MHRSVVCPLRGNAVVLLFDVGVKGRVGQVPFVAASTSELTTLVVILASTTVFWLLIITTILVVTLVTLRVVFGVVLLIGVFL